MKSKMDGSLWAPIIGAFAAAIITTITTVSQFRKAQSDADKAEQRQKNLETSLNESKEQNTELRKSLEDARNQLVSLSTGSKKFPKFTASSRPPYNKVITIKVENTDSLPLFDLRLTGYSGWEQTQLDPM